MNQSDRMLRDLSDGIMVVDTSGTVVHVNPAAAALLGMTEDLQGRKYASLMAGDREENLPFHQMLIDAVENKEALHRRNVDYIRPDGGRSVLEVTSSWSEDGNERPEVILTMSDRSEEQRHRKKMIDASVCYNYILCVVCLWVFVTAIWNFLGQPVSTSVLSKTISVVTLLLMIPAKLHADFTWKDFGLNFNRVGRNILVDSVIGVGALGLLCLVKLVLMKKLPGFFPDGRPFFDFGKYTMLDHLLYLVEVACQELVTRGIVHEVLRHLMQNRYKEVTSILVSSLIFGAMHIHVGLVYMLGAALLLGALGLLYRRQGNIWGLCIPHFILGSALGILDFVAF